jgi:hypothetical protein
LEKVVEIDEFSVDLKPYRNLEQDLNRQATGVIHEIESILDILHPLLRSKPVSVWKEFHAKFK